MTECTAANLFPLRVDHGDVVTQELLPEGVMVHFADGYSELFAYITTGMGGGAELFPNDPIPHNN
jgi:hypothetical protein